MARSPTEGSASPTDDLQAHAPIVAAPSRTTPAGADGPGRPARGRRAPAPSARHRAPAPTVASASTPRRGSHLGLAGAHGPARRQQAHHRAPVRAVRAAQWRLARRPGRGRRHPARWAAARRSGRRRSAAARDAADRRAELHAWRASSRRHDRRVARSASASAAACRCRGASADGQPPDEPAPHVGVDHADRRAEGERGDGARRVRTDPRKPLQAVDVARPAVRRHATAAARCSASARRL